MYTVVLKAEKIPDGTIVRKLTGSKEYKLRRTLKIYGEMREEIQSEGICFLVDANGINAYRDDKEFAIDFDTTTDAIEFLQEIKAADHG